MSKVELKHEHLDSEIATAAGLFNEWIKWCQSVDITPLAMTKITQAFQTKTE